jgi:hypothetical protein
MRLSIGVLVLAAALGLAGCHAPEGTGQTDGVEETRPVPGYGEVREKYNARAGKVEKLWSRAVVEMDYFDEEKQGRKFEQGDGHLILVKPDWVALSMGKAGHPIVWAGRDPLRYWLFVLGDEKKAYVGKVANLGKPATKSLGLPISLDQLMLLSGLEELPEMGNDSAASVAWEGGLLRVNLPGVDVDMLIDPETWLARQIRVHAGDKVKVMSTLSQPDTVTMSNQPPGAFPTIQTNIKITYPGKEDSLTLFLSGMTDGEGGKIKPAVFDFETLGKLLKVGQVVDLDAK